MAKAAWTHRGRESRQARGYGAEWDRLRPQIFKRDEYLCQLCLAAGRITVAAQIDHIKPRAQGGTDDPENLRSLCEPCHTKVTLEQQGKRPRPRVAFDKHGRPLDPRHPWRRQS